MTTRRTTWQPLALMLMMAASSACTHDNPKPVPKEFEFGARRVQVVVPEGWEALDQGKQKRFRKGEFEIVLQDLGPRTPPPRDLNELFDWGLAAVGHNERRDVKSRRAVTLDGREAMDIETWSRLDHTNPQRIFLVTDDGDLLALHTAGMTFADSLAAFDAIRGSLHFVSARPSTEQQARQTPARPPNIVFILVDDMRWDDFAAGGHPFIETPNMDRLAREGVRFLNAFATTPLCSPSRASLLTGQYARTHGIIDNTARPSHNLPVFPIELQRAGYTTGFFGKWHMGNDDSPRPGFNRWVALPGQGEAVDPHVNIDGQPQQLKGYVTDLLTDHVDEFIRNASATGKPFMAYLAHKAIHPNVTQQNDGSIVTIADQPGGFVAADRHRGRYAGRTMPRRPNAFKAPVDKPALMRTIGALPPLGRETATTDDEIRGRLEMLLAVDDSLGRIMATLEKASALENTVIVFTSDHGYFYGEHGLNEERRLAYEETIRIPLLVRYPSRIKAGSVASDLVLTIDLAPTVLSLAGLTPPATIEGRSLVPILNGESRDWRKSFMVEYYSDTVFPRVLTMGYSAVRTDRYKYIEYRELQNMNELYDLQTDPYEERNLISAPTAASVLESLRRELAALRGVR